ncbi:hypothetical protein BLA29_004239 [Euroglyphus maynei]|uniref:Uncharacterized protein n=1 Tax=Euroglyphus maynei TaxID=6958 RepID=A0A1Y3BVN6_EURMA|nr:hypothetical protein BLA29_004239 [Euroglyphus maynei]
MRKKEQMRMINKLIWFVTIISFQLIIPCFTSEEPNIVSYGWLIADATTKYWPLNDTGDGEFYVYDKISENNEILKLNTNLFDEKNSNYTISFNYWKPKNDLRWQYHENSDKTEITLDEEGKEFTKTKGKRLTSDQWKNLELVSRNKLYSDRVFFKDINVVYKQKINLSHRKDPVDNFKNSHNNGFEDPNNPNSIKFHYKGSTNESSTLQQVISKDDFGKTCIKIEPTEDELKGKLKISVTFDHETDAIELPLKLPEICLGEYFALKPNVDIMITINVEPGENEFDVEFTKNGNQSVELEVPKNEISEKWIFNHPLFDYDIMLELKSGDGIEIYACDVMANCFQYVTDDNIVYKLESFSQDALSESPIIKRYFVKNGKYIQNLKFETKTTMEEKVLQNIQKMIKPNKNVVISDNKIIIPEVNESIIIPYIDLRAYPNASLSVEHEMDSINVTNK